MVGQRDLIYGNSLDHSCDPPMCLDQWMKCVKPEGFCYIGWSEMHGEDSASEADPFGASEEEYREMLNAATSAREANEFPVARKTSSSGTPGDPAPFAGYQRRAYTFRAPVTCPSP